MLSGVDPRFDHDGGTVVGNPSKVSIGMYAFYLSQNEDCSAPVAMTDNGSTAVVKDFAQNPVLFTGTPAAGTYKCVILRISDAMQRRVPGVWWTRIQAGEYSPVLSLEGPHPGSQRP